MYTISTALDGHVRPLRPLDGVGEGQPVGRMGGEQAHAVTLVHGQGDVGQVAQHEHELLTKV